jgi:penicillin-binding protein 1A
MGGKTGTTQNHADGWFMGVTPNLVVGVWVGAEDRSVHFATITKGQGANMALPIWALFLKKVYNDPTMKVKSTDTFRQPLNFDYELDCDDEDNEEDNNDNDENLFGTN